MLVFLRELQKYGGELRERVEAKAAESIRVGTSSHAARALAALPAVLALGERSHKGGAVAHRGKALKPTGLTTEQAVRTFRRLCVGDEAWGADGAARRGGAREGGRNRSTSDGSGVSYGSGGEEDGRPDERWGVGGVGYDGILPEWAKSAEADWYVDQWLETGQGKAAVRTAQRRLLREAGLNEPALPKSPSKSPNKSPSASSAGHSLSRTLSGESKEGGGSGGSGGSSRGGSGGGGGGEAKDGCEDAAIAEVRSERLLLTRREMLEHPDISLAVLRDFVEGVVGGEVHSDMGQWLVERLEQRRKGAAALKRWTAAKEDEDELVKEEQRRVIPVTQAVEMVQDLFSRTYRQQKMVNRMNDPATQLNPNVCHTSRSGLDPNRIARKLRQAAAAERAERAHTGEGGRHAQPIETHAVQVASISLANPAVVVVRRSKSNAKGTHRFETGDRAFVSGTNLVPINGRAYSVAKVSKSSFALVGCDTSALEGEGAAKGGTSGTIRLQLGEAATMSVRTFRETLETELFSLLADTATASRARSLLSASLAADARIHKAMASARGRERFGQRVSAVRSKRDAVRSAALETSCDSVQFSAMPAEGEGADGEPLKSTEEEALDEWRKKLIEEQMDVEFPNDRIAAAKAAMEMEAEKEKEATGAYTAWVKAKKKTTRDARKKKKAAAARKQRDVVEKKSKSRKAYRLWKKGAVRGQYYSFAKNREVRLVGRRRLYRAKRAYRKLSECAVRGADTGDDTRNGAWLC